VPEVLEVVAVPIPAERDGDQTIAAHTEQRERLAGLFAVPTSAR
jgi:hypothetical protein